MMMFCMFWLLFASKILSEWILNRFLCVSQSMRNTFAMQSLHIILDQTLFCLFPVVAEIQVQPFIISLMVLWYQLRNVLFFGPKKCLNEFKSRVAVNSKRRFWSTLFSLRKRTKINFCGPKLTFHTWS